MNAVKFICEDKDYPLNEEFAWGPFLPNMGDFIQLPEWKIGYRVVDRHWAGLVDGLPLMEIFLKPD